MGKVNKNQILCECGKVAELYCAMCQLTWCEKCSDEEGIEAGDHCDCQSLRDKPSIKEIK